MPLTLDGPVDGSLEIRLVASLKLIGELVIGDSVARL